MAKKKIDSTGIDLTDPEQVRNHIGFLETRLAAELRSKVQDTRFVNVLREQIKVSREHLENLLKKK